MRRLASSFSRSCCPTRKPGISRCSFSPSRCWDWRRSRTGLFRFGSALLNKQERGQKWQVAMASTYKGHVIVCGLGKLGYRVILELLEFGREVVGIELDANGRFVERIQALNVPVVLADARREENLHQGGCRPRGCHHSLHR